MMHYPDLNQPLELRHLLKKEIVRVRLIKLMLMVSFAAIFIGFEVDAATAPEPQQKEKSGINASVAKGVVQQRRHEGSVIQHSQQLELIQNIQDTRIPLNPVIEPEVKPEAKPVVEAAGNEDLLGNAWQEYNRRNYREAKDMFTKILLVPEKIWEAKYGLAMSHVKLKNDILAIQLLQEVAAIQPHLKDTLSTLTMLLIEHGQLEQARFHALRMRTQQQKTEWVSKIDEALFLRRIREAKQIGDADGYRALTQEYRQKLKECVWPGAFFELAGLLAKSGDNDQALDIYHTLLFCTGDPSLRIGIYSSMKLLLPLSEMLALLEDDRVQLKPDKSPAEHSGYSIQLGAFANPDNAKRIVAEMRKKGIESSLLYKENGTHIVHYGDFPTRDKAREIAKKLVAKRVFSSYFITSKPLLTPHAEERVEAVQIGQILVPTTPEYVGKINILKLEILNAIMTANLASTGVIAPKILAISPNDTGALTALAWWHFNANDYDKSYNLFLKLQKKEPDNENYTLGLMYCLMRLKRFDDALKLAEKHHKSEKIKTLAKQVKLTALWEKMAAAGSESAEIETLAKEMLAISPDDDNIKLILAWWYFRSDNFETAYEEFKKLYEKSPDVKDHSYGLAISLNKLGRIDEAIAVAERNKEEDERSASLLAAMYLDKAHSVYKEKRYLEAQENAEKSLAITPEAGTQELLDLYRYKQTLFSRAMSKLEGLYGSSYGSLGQDILGSTGFSVSASIQQGIDWLKLPGDITFSTYGVYKYSTRTGERRYFDASGYGFGVEFRKSIYKLGAEYFWDTFTQQNQTKTTKLLYLSWFHDWTKRIWFDDEDTWLKLNALSGSTYGKTTHDFSGSTGTSISGFVNQGIDWFTLPGEITFNTYGEYRLSFRTKDTKFYNAHGPAVGFEFQKSPFTLGANYFWQMFTERGVIDRQAGVYLRWYYDWDLKPVRDR